MKKTTLFWATVAILAVIFLLVFALAVALSS
jgi:hypothetical protein